MEIESQIYAHKDRLYRLCMHLEKDTYRAEELFQDTWVKVVEKWQSYDPLQDFYPWLTQIAVNTYRDKLRRLKREIKRVMPLEEEKEMASTMPSMEEQLTSKEVVDVVREQIQLLPDKYKVPLILVVAEHYSYKQVAEVLGIQEKLVKSRIYEARQKLKVALEKEGYNEG